MRTILFGFVLWAVAMAANNHQSVKSLSLSDLSWVEYCQQNGIEDPEVATMEQVYAYANLFDGATCFDILNENGTLAWVVYCHQNDVDPKHPTEEQENYFLDVWTGGQMDVALEK